MSFETIVASGERSALPHGVASAAKLPAAGFVVLDYGVVLAGYCSDMTRTVHVGKVSGEERALYRAVLEAQLAAISVVRAGITAAEVDRAARQELKRAKLDRFFTHSTGHGVGLEIHELPRLAAGNDAILQSGMVITIEPGAYLPGKCGVRIEDMLLVTERGYEVLTPVGKELIELD
jgi:Xaa-Pro aminopeptidase